MVRVLRKPPPGGYASPVSAARADEAGASSLSRKTQDKVVVGQRSSRTSHLWEGTTRPGRLPTGLLRPDYTEDQAGAAPRGNNGSRPRTGRTTELPLARLDTRASSQASRYSQEGGHHLLLPGGAGAAEHGDRRGSEAPGAVPRHELGVYPVQQPGCSTHGLPDVAHHVPQRWRRAWSRCPRSDVIWDNMATKWWRVAGARTRWWAS